MTTVLIIIGVLILFSLGIFAFLRWKDKQREEKPSEPVSNQEPTTEPEQPQKPVSESKFKIGDYVKHQHFKDEVFLVESINVDGSYSLKSVSGNEGDDIAMADEEFMEWWTIFDAKDGDVIYHTCHGHECYDIIKEVIGELGKKGEKVTFHISLSMPDGYVEAGCYSNITTMMKAKPATKEQRDLLFAKIAEAGYQWDADTKTLSKIEDVDDGDPVEDFIELIDYFSQVVPIGEKTREYLYNSARFEKNLVDRDLFPTPYDYFGENENTHVRKQFLARLFAQVLSELIPDKAEQLSMMGYNYPIVGSIQTTYGYTFETDPNVARDVADMIYSATIDDSVIEELREEIGGKMVSYKNDVSELFLDNTKWMPTAPPPYLDAYKNRPKGEPFDSEYTEYMDNEINTYVAQYYNLDTKDAEKRQETIQAISNKEYKKPHLFGKPRTVTDPVYGTMTFYPVFGVHNIGIEIDPNGKIADLAYSIGRICSDSRKPLLDQEYGRKRPAQGDSDPSANPIAERRALVNEAIENGDGHSTGHYDKNGDYVFDDGTHVGNYVDYYQGQQFANSYTSGHSGHIKGVAMVLAMIMPDKVCEILKAMIEFCNGRVICRYHNQSDTIHGRVVGGFIVPVLRACTNIDFKNRLAAAREEYKNGGVVPTPTDKVNVTLSYSCGGYGSCHVDAGETSISHKCNKEANRDRQPSIICSQTVNFTIEGDAGVTAAGGKTSGIFEANKSYVLFCPAVKEGEEKIAKIILNNNNGTRILYYKLSWNGTHDDGIGTY